MSSIESSLPITMSPSVVSNSMVEALGTDQNNLATLETEISTGFAINTPSDNPEGAANILQLNASLTRFTQYQTNAADGQGWLQSANNTVNSILSVLQSVQSTVEAVSGQQLSGNGSELPAIAEQVNAALSEISNLANTTYENGQPLFAGTGNATEAYDSEGNYVGAGSAPTRTVAPGTQIAVSVTGPQLFGSGTTGLLSQTPGSLGVLAQIASDLQTGTSASLNNVETTDLSNLSAAIQTVEGAASTLGANQDAIEQFSSQAQEAATALQTQMGSVQDVNMATAITNLQLQQTSYQAALWATSQLTTDNLAQYL